MNKLYVLGHPVAHSKSPVMHNALYKKLGLDWHYDVMDCQDEKQAWDFMAAGDYLGLNITMPYKPHAFEVATFKYPSAVLARGANVLVHQDDALACHNMDGSGCLAYLEQSGISFAGAEVVVCGTGPTSLALMHSAAVHGAARVTLVGRNFHKTELVLDGYLERLALSEDADLATDCAFAAEDYQLACTAVEQDWDDLEDAPTFTRADVIMDATPLGMKAGDPAPFEAELLRPDQVVFDVVYGHGQTQLAKNAADRGCRFLDGQGMLVGQAVLGAGEFLASAAVDADISFEEAFCIMKEAAGF